MTVRGILVVIQCMQLNFLFSLHLSIKSYKSLKKVHIMDGISTRCSRFFSMEYLWAKRQQKTPRFEPIASGSWAQCFTTRLLDFTWEEGYKNIHVRTACRHVQQKHRPYVDVFLRIMICIVSSRAKKQFLSVRRLHELRHTFIWNSTLKTSSLCHSIHKYLQKTLGRYFIMILRKIHRIFYGPLHPRPFSIKMWWKAAISTPKHLPGHVHVSSVGNGVP